MFDSVVLFPFDLVHSDVWSSPIFIFDGLRYYDIFLDSILSFRVALSIKHKYGVFSKFLHFHAYIKNQFKYDIKIFQCEYDNKVFHDLCDRNGIIIQFSCPYTCQQNGNFEQMI